MRDNLLNWAGNYTYRAARVHYPETVEQVRELMKNIGRLKALGTRHSFNDIADTTEDLISTERLNRVVRLDRDKKTVTVEAGIRYGHLCRYLHGEGFALHNLASLPHISVAGSCATATHGSGDANGNLPTAVSALEMVTAGGDLITLSREANKDDFSGAVVGLGGLGVVTELTLDILPAFTVRQDVYRNLPLAVAQAHFDEIMSSGYSVSLFTDWQGDAFSQVWRKRRVEPDESMEPASEFFGATPAPGPLHPIATMSPVNCTEQMGIPGPWHERLPHFRLEFTPSSGEELQSEYIVPRRHAVAALAAVFELREQVTPLLQISEVRTVAADDLWMSPCCGQPCVCLHFTWKKDWPGVRELLPLLEERLAPFDARPHWGKLFTMSPALLQSLYPQLPDFRTLLRRYDPDGRFHNGFLETYILPP